MFQKTSLVLFLFFISFVFSQNREANDCVNYIQTCGNQTITLNPTGYGVQELDNFNSCKGLEHNSLWLKFTVKTSGTLGFDLIPNNISLTTDYDFWVFGPDAVCGSLGSARCSTTNPLAAGLSNNHTGLRDSEPIGNYSEGPGADGDGYVKSLDVIAGESYFLLIDRPMGNGSFSLNWTGTAILEDPFTSTPNAFGTAPSIDVCNTNALYDLSNYTANILNSNLDFNVYYYTNFDDATYDDNRINAPIKLANQDYFYRIQSTTSECFVVGKIQVKWKPFVLNTVKIQACKETNNEAVFNLNSANLTNEVIADVKYYLTLQEARDHIPGTEILTPASYSSVEKSVFAWVKTQYGCESSAEMILSFYPDPNINTNLYNANRCDDDLDGSVSLKFSDISFIIVNNSTNFNIYYYLASNPGVPLPDNFTFTQDTDIIVEVRSKNGCSSVFGTINFKIRPQIVLNTVPPREICDEDRSGNELINLNIYASLFTSQATTILAYATLNDAKKNINSIPFSQDLKASKSIFFRFENSLNCPSVGELKLIFKNPKISDSLRDVAICKDDSITLDAGSGFDAYLWSSGSVISSSGILKIGDHWVDLTFDGCTTRQNVKVIAEEVIIKILMIENDQLTITVTGGTAPYEYSLDGYIWQSSNVFKDIPKGIQKAYARSSKKCIPTVREFSNIHLLNFISPNSDGKNDVLDYSDISLKNNVKFQIFDRSGKPVFVGKDGNYIWDGKDGSRILSTGTYWYTLEWTEPDTGVIKKFNSWILLKNR